MSWLLYYRHFSKSYTLLTIGRFKLARFLIEHGANVNAVDKSRDTPLHLIAVAGYTEDHYKIAQLLLEHGADSAAKDFANATPIEVAFDERSNFI